jgi:hypothetical protein
MDIIRIIMKKELKILSIGKYLILSVLLLCISCNGTPPASPAPVKAIFADISGDYNASYASPGRVWATDLEVKKQIYCSGYSFIDGLEYDLVISLYFADKIEKTGTFKLVRSHIMYSEDVAVGALGIGYDPTRKVYFSDSGYVTISEITSQTLKGTFEFFAKDTTGKGSLIVKNGIINIQQSY